MARPARQPTHLSVPQSAQLQPEDHHLAERSGPNGYQWHRGRKHPHPRTLPELYTNYRGLGGDGIFRLCMGTALGAPGNDTITHLPNTDRSRALQAPYLDSLCHRKQTVLLSIVSKEVAALDRL